MPPLVLVRECDTVYLGVDEVHFPFTHTRNYRVLPQLSPQPEVYPSDTDRTVLGIHGWDDYSIGVRPGSPKRSEM